MSKTALITCMAALPLLGAAQNGPVIPTGAMRNTMFNGQLAGLIQLDSIAKPPTKDEESAVRELARRLRTGHADTYAALADRLAAIVSVSAALRTQMAETAQNEVQAQFNETAVTDRIEAFLEASLQGWQQG